MIDSFKSELRKLTSVRMTYVVTLAGILIVGGLMCFYGYGLNGASSGAEGAHYLEEVMLSSANFMTAFISIAALLMVTHEYRYNMIMYTLTSSNKRTKTFVSKLLVISLFALVVTALIMIIGPLLAILGMKIKDVTLAPQSIPYLSLAWRGLFFGWGMATAAAVIAYIIRNQVGAIATFFVAINTVEGLLGLLLKQNAKWLPFTSLQYVVNAVDAQAAQEVAARQGYWNPSQAALLFTGYLVFGSLVAWILFLRRDAN